MQILALVLPALVAGRQATADGLLEVPVVIQEQSQWCWAGVSRSILLFFGVDIAQCDIAEYARLNATWHDYGSEYCCDNPGSDCNYWNYNYGSEGSIQTILENWGVPNDGVSRALLPSEVSTFIDTQRPFIIRWGHPGGSGHFVIGRGIEGDSIHYMDPWFSEGYKTATYDWMVASALHDWTHTNVLSRSPDCWCFTEDDCCDGCEYTSEGMPCEDGSLCTSDDICLLGVCSGAEIHIQCPEVDDECKQPGRCDPQTGQCSAPLPVEDGARCESDGLDCTGDQCLAGECNHPIKYGCMLDGHCFDHQQRSDDNPCLFCDDSNPDEWSTLSNGATCDDGSFCTVDDTCIEGDCVSGAERNCEGFTEPCVEAVCDESALACTTVPSERGTECGSPMCDDGILLPAPRCDGAGGCLVAEAQYCSPYRCLDDISCATSCDTEHDCLSGLECLAGVCRSPGDLETDVDVWTQPDLETDEVNEGAGQPEDPSGKGSGSGCGCHTRGRQAPVAFPSLMIFGWLLVRGHRFKGRP